MADHRRQSPAVIGNIFVFGKSIPLETPLSLEKVLFDRWRLSLSARNEQSIPLEIELNEISVHERKIAPNKIAGDMKVKLTFRWTREAQSLLLTGYASSSTYTRPETNYDHEALLRRLIDGGIRHFDQWFGLNEGKNPILARGIILKFEDIQFSDQPDTVFYSRERKLGWNDFQGHSNRPGSKYAAAVFSSMSYEGHSRMDRNNLILTIYMKVFMVKSMSWVRPEAKNDYTLNHEQTHFDITRIVAERFKERLKKLDLTIEDYDSQIQFEFLEAFKEMNDEQKKYDNLTRHGLDTIIQSDWKEKVTNKINGIYQDS